MYMPFLGSTGQLTHVFVSTRGENNDAGDKNIVIDGAVRASDFKIESSSLVNIAPTLQAVTEQASSTTQTISISNPTTSIIAQSEIIAGSFRGVGTRITSINGNNIIAGTVREQELAGSSVTTTRIANEAVTDVKLAGASVSTDKLQDSSVTTAKLNDASVTTSKLANISITTPKIADSSVTSAKIANGSITADKIAAGAVGTAFLGDENVTTSKLANGAVTTAKIADANITTAKLVDSSVTESKITNGAVTTAKIADANITTAKLVDSSVTESKITNGAVTTAKIADASITGDKIQNASIPLSKLETTDLTIGQINNNSISELKLERSSIRGGSKELFGDNRGTLAIETIHNDNIRDSTIIANEKLVDGSISTNKIADDAITASKLASDVTLQAITGGGATTDRAISISNASSTSTTTGALTVAGGVGVTGNVYAAKFIGDGSGLTGVPTTLQSVTAGGATTDRAISISNASSTSTTTGALIVTGGVGVTGNVYAGFFHGDGSNLSGISSTLQAITAGGATTDKAISISNVTTSTSTISGALVVAGGVGVSGNVYASKFIGDGSGLTGVPTTLQAVTAGGTTTDQVISISNSTASIDTGSGALIVTGGVGVSGNVHAGFFHGDGSNLSGVNLQTVLTNGNSSDQMLVITNEEDTVEGLTGALRISGGGLYVKKNIRTDKDLIVTGNLIVNGTTTTIDSTSLTVKDTIVSIGQGNDSGSKDVGLLFGKSLSNVAIFYDISDAKLKFGLTESHASSNQITLKSDNLPILISGSVTANAASFTDTTLSTSTTTGALTVTGGVGVSGNVYAAKFIGDGSGLSSLNGSNVSSGTIDNARLPSTINVTNLIGNGSGLSSLNASNVSSGTLPSARIAADSITLTQLNSDVTLAGITGHGATTSDIVSFTNTTDASAGAGAVTITGGLYVAKKIYAGDDITAFSDRRKKSNIERIENALDKVSQLNGYTFDYNGERKTGVIAQEVKEVLPEAVYGSEDTTYSVAYGNLVGILIEAIKELKNEIDQLKNT